MPGESFPAVRGKRQCVAAITVPESERLYAPSAPPQTQSEGLTNREIGQKLYLSPRTISSHLYRAYPKLGITSRAQLREALEHKKPGHA